MYAKLRIELDSSQISYQQSSNLQGVLMEQIDTDYAQELHQYSLNPYSQYVVKEKDKTVWYICTVNEEAYENIILPLEELKQITIRRKEITTNVVGRSIEILEESELMKQFYEESCDRYLNLQFCTPTAFKRDGKYVNYPDLRLVYGSLMRKYSAASEELDMYDEETLEDHAFSTGKSSDQWICGECLYQDKRNRDDGKLYQAVMSFWRIFRCGNQNQYGNGSNAAAQEGETWLMKK